MGVAGVTPRRTRDIAAVTAFLAMAGKKNLMLNGHAARDVWDAWMRILELPPGEANELLCRMLGDVPED